MQSSCEFKKSLKWDASPTGSFEGFEGDLKNANIIIAKVILLLKQILEEFHKFYITFLFFSPCYSFNKR